MRAAEEEIPAHGGPGRGVAVEGHEFLGSRKEGGGGGVLAFCSAWCIYSILSL